MGSDHHENRAKMKLPYLSGVLILAFWLGACAAVPPVVAEGAPSLYQRVGGKPALSLAMQKLLARVRVNPAIQHHFVHSDLEFLAEQLTTQFCQATGGPCVYDGPNMQRAHRGLNIKAVEFEAMAEDLRAVLVELQVPAPEQQALLRLFNSMQEDVILR